MGLLTNFRISLPCLHVFFLFSYIYTLNSPDFGSVTAYSMLQNSTSDLSALLSIKSVLQDPSGSLASWGNEQLPYCNWSGITCHTKFSTRVSVLNLDSFGINGFISPHIANLTFLHILNLANNNIYGSIPEELGLISHLKYINMRNNSLTGTVPNGLFSHPNLLTLNLRRNKLEGSIFTLLANTSISLRNIDIGRNNLTGKIPSWLFNNSQLKHVDLSINNIGGSLEVSPGARSSLKYLSVGTNKFVGNIPASLCTISSSLEHLDLSDNKLSGNIPSSVGNCSTKLLYLHQNLLTGALPPFSSNSFLQDLSLYENQLSGGLPASLGNNSHFLHLYFSESNFSGNIPDSFGRLSHLLELDLSQNSLTGKIPSSIYNLTSLTYLGVGSNKLVGTIPENIGTTLPNIQTLNLQTNKFVGHIPNSLTNATSLQVIDLLDNYLSGLIPSNLGSLNNLSEVSIGWNEVEAPDWEFLWSLTNCTRLEILSFEDNNIKGMLPNFIGNFSTNLKRLLVGMNHIYGPIPSEIGNLVGLILLCMDDCLFTGNIPSTFGELHKVEYLNIGGNRLSSPIPPSLSNLTKLSEVHMEENQLTGKIPSSFENCTRLTFLNLSHNLFTAVPEELFSLFSLSKALDISNNLLSGPLPVEVGKLISLSLLDISENNFSQEIPPTLGHCVVLQYLYMSGNSFQGNIAPSFRSLNNLKVLDLSRNQLRGCVPDFFQDDNSLEFLNLAHNDLEGMVSERGLFSNSTRFSIVGNKKLCGGLKDLDLPSCVLANRRFLFHMSNSLVIIMLVLVAFICLVSSLITIQWIRKRTIKPSPSDEKFKRITYRDIAEATNGFSPEYLIGSGSSSSVYKGKLGFPEKSVAIKVFNVFHSLSLKGFDAECKVLRKLRHRNLVKIITLCSSLDSKGSEFKALVFEYMHNGSLEDWLHPKTSELIGARCLNLKQRVIIAADVAFALNYLHHEHGNSPIVHCDIKPSNVLLDSDMTAHLSDFGLSQFLLKSTSTSSLGELKGTIGYIPPEYGVGNTVSTQGDVYSFGVLLLEMLTGRKPTDCIFKDGLNICKLVDMAYPDRITDVLDPVLFDGEFEESSNNSNIKFKDVCDPIMEKCIVPLLSIGLSCCKDSARKRMDMKDVANKIHAIKKVSLEI